MKIASSVCVAFAVPLVVGCASDPTTSQAPLAKTRAAVEASGAGDHPCAAEDDHARAPNMDDSAPGTVAWSDGLQHSRTFDVRLLAMNDFHGQITRGRTFGSARRPVGGAAVLRSWLRAYEKPSTFITFSGDSVGASPPESGLLRDEPTLMFFNMLGNDHCKRASGGGPSNDRLCNVIAAVGNHEFDLGRAELLRKIYGGNAANGPFLEDPWRGANFPWLAANVLDTATGKPILPPYVVREVVPGTTLGFIGAVTSTTPSIVTPSGVAGLTFTDEATAINAAAAELKSKGVRSLVVLLHEGGTQTQYDGPTAPGGTVTGRIATIVKQLDPEIDVVLSGHAHNFTNALLPSSTGKPILVTQAFSYSTAFASVDLVIDADKQDIVQKSASIVVAYADTGPGLTPDAEAKALVDQASAAVAPIVNRIVGYTSVDLLRRQSTAGESNLGNLIADAQRASMPGLAAAFMNPGGIRADLLASGQTVAITWGQLYSIQPFANDVVAMTLTPAQIYKLLEQQWEGQPTGVVRMLQIAGISYTWKASAPLGARIVSVSLNGVPLERTDTLTPVRVAVNSFLATGGDNFKVLTEGTDRVVGPVDVDALVDHVSKFPESAPITIGVEGRATRVD